MQGPSWHSVRVLVTARHPEGMVSRVETLRAHLQLPRRSRRRGRVEVRRPLQRPVLRLAAQQAPCQAIPAADQVLWWAGRGKATVNKLGVCTAVLLARHTRPSQRTTSC